MRSIALRINVMGGVAIPGVVAGAIYFVIALTTGASAVVSITYGILLGAIVATIGLVIRSVYERKAAELHH
jgi:hypothetical protein